VLKTNVLFSWRIIMAVTRKILRRQRIAGWCMIFLSPAIFIFLGISIWFGPHQVTIAEKILCFGLVPISVLLSVFMGFRIIYSTGRRLRAGDFEESEA
jgi:hypothetical protein